MPMNKQERARRAAAHELKGEELDQATRDADIEGRSGMSADEKREALLDAGAEGTGPFAPEREDGHA